MSQKNKPFDHPALGGKVVDHNPYKKLQDKKVIKKLSPEELLNKAYYGSPKILTHQEKTEIEKAKLKK